MVAIGECGIEKKNQAVKNNDFIPTQSFGFFFLSKGEYVTFIIIGEKAENLIMWAEYFSY